MPGWSWDDDDESDEFTIREGENAVRQTHRLIELIADAVEGGVSFELGVETICELNSLATEVAGQVLSGSFISMSPSERQDRIWLYLDQELTLAERTKISFIVTDTPEEHEALTGT